MSVLKKNHQTYVKKLNGKGQKLKETHGNKARAIFHVIK